MKVPVVVKRLKASYFLEVDESEKVRDLKEKLAVMLKKPPSELQLMLKEEIMQEKRSVRDYGIETTKVSDVDPIVLGLCYRLPGSGGHFERLTISEATRAPRQ